MNKDQLAGWTMKMPPDIGERIRDSYPSFGDRRKPPRDPLGEYRHAFTGVCAFLDGETAGISDGRALHVWSLDEPDAPRRTVSLADGGLAPTMAALSSPWLTPAADLGAGRRLHLLRGYDADLDYVTVPVIFDPAAATPFVALRPAGRDVIGGCTPKQVLVAPDLATVWIAGTIDGGAVCNLDEFIPVAAAYRLDLAAGRYVWSKGIPAGPWRPAGVMVAGLQYCVADGRVDLLPWDRPRITPDGAAIAVSPAEGAPNAFRLPLARQLADPTHVLDLVVTSRAGDDILVLDMSAGDSAWVHRLRL